MSLADQRVVIIGGSSGMGLATAHAAAADQIAATNLYLMENGFVTGTVLTVDGGFILTAS